MLLKWRQPVKRLVVVVSRSKSAFAAKRPDCGSAYLDEKRTVADPARSIAVARVSRGPRSQVAGAGAPGMLALRASPTFVTPGGGDEYSITAVPATRPRARR